MDLNFDLLDESLLETNQNNNNKILVKETERYDKTTVETYRIKRLYKIDPLTDHKIPNQLIFEYNYRWNPYTGKRLDIEPVGSLCFNALTLYDYYFSNRFKGLWNPAEDNFQGYYGDLIGAGEEAAHAFKTEEGEEGQPQDIATARVTKRAECARPSLALCCSQAKRRSSGRSSRFGRMMRRAARQPCSRRSRSPKRLSFPPAANA